MGVHSSRRGIGAASNVRSSILPFPVWILTDPPSGPTAFLSAPAFVAFALVSNDFTVRSESFLRSHRSVRSFFSNVNFGGFAM